MHGHGRTLNVPRRVSVLIGEIGMRLKILVLAFAFALLAAFHPSDAQAGKITDQMYACGKGSFLVGIQGHIGVWIDQLQPVCATWDSVKHRQGPEEIGPVFGNIEGGGVTLKRAVCSPGFAIYRLYYGIAIPDGWPGHVQKLVVLCASIEAGDHEKSHDDLGGWPDHDPLHPEREHVSQCPGSYLANSLVIGLDGINIATLTPNCDDPEVILASAPHSPGIDVKHALDLHDVAVNKPQNSAPKNSAKDNMKSARERMMQSQPASTPSVPPSDDIQGDWKTSEGPMTLDQDGNKLQGTYAQDSGRIKAHREGGSWEGFWSEAKSDRRCDNDRLGSNYWGRITFLFSDQNRHFEALWSYCGDDPSGGKRWSGDRVN